jgi:hypothetical protein
VYDTTGNPTPTLSEPLKDGGQFAPQTGGSGAGNVALAQNLSPRIARVGLVVGF